MIQCYFHDSSVHIPHNFESDCWVCMYMNDEIVLGSWLFSIIDGPFFSFRWSCSVVQWTGSFKNYVWNLFRHQISNKKGTTNVKKDSNFQEVQCVQMFNLQKSDFLRAGLVIAKKFSWIGCSIVLISFQILNSG